MTIMIRPTDELYEVNQISWQMEFLGVLLFIIVCGLIIKTIIKKVVENRL